MTAPQTREDRTCAKCGLTDNHAHHVQYVAFAHPVTGEGMDLSVTKHVQCCAEDGCPICSVSVRELSASDIGDAFDQELQQPSGDVLRVLFEEVAIESPDYNIPATQEA